MSIFDKKTQDRAIKNGGFTQPEGGAYSAEEQEQGIALFKRLASGESTGFFYMVETSPEGPGKTRAEGMMKVKSMDKTKVLEIVMRGLGMDKDAIRMYLMMKSISED